MDFDIFIRWLEATGYRVTFCRNVTDIEDKILRPGQAEGTDADRGRTNQRAFAWAYAALGCLPPDVEPRATGHIPEMVALIGRLIELGHAYAGERRRLLRRAQLPGLRRALRPAPGGHAPRRGRRRQRDQAGPADFTLWKGAKPGEPSWETPWGPGRPGWHLECSAMSTKYLGTTFDIHGGGMDLIFPHHENEIAQSRAAGDASPGTGCTTGCSGWPGRR